jgi:hypothetical protein
MKRNMDKKRPAADISELNAAQCGAEITKARSGKIGVEFRFHTYDEYDNLTQEQRQNLMNIATPANHKVSLESFRR